MMGSQLSADEQRVLDWVIFSGTTTEAEISSKFKAKPAAVRAMVQRLAGEDIIILRKRFWSSEVTFNPNSERGLAEKSIMLPSMEVRGDEKLFKTNLDILQSAVNRLGPVSLARTARFFRVRQHVVECWAKVLHDQGLISLFYPLVGEPMLLRVGERQPVVNATLLRYLAAASVIIIALLEKDAIAGALAAIGLI
jgi:hypothetical protein